MILKNSPKICNFFLYQFPFLLTQCYKTIMKLAYKISSTSRKNTDIDDDSIEIIKTGLQYMPPISNYPC